MNQRDAQSVSDSPTSAQRQIRAWLFVVLLTAAFALPGCAGGGFLSYVFGAGEIIKAKYKLQDRDTLILVDDPNRRLGSSTMPAVVSNNVKHHLQGQQENTKDFMPGAKFLTASDLSDLHRTHGQNLAKMPIDDIGRLAGVDQVIYVEVESASLYHQTRQVTKPQAMVSVKVIDVVERKRLFPPGPKLEDSSHVPPGFPVKVTMRYDGTDDSGGRGSEAVLRQKLAEETGKKVAEVFYDHNKPQPGRNIK